MTSIPYHPLQNSYRTRERPARSKGSIHLLGIEYGHTWHILRDTHAPYIQHECRKLGVGSDTCYPSIGEDQKFKVILSHLSSLRPACGHLGLCLKQTKPKPKQRSEKGERKERQETGPEAPTMVSITQLCAYCCH